MSLYQAAAGLPLSQNCRSARTLVHEAVPLKDSTVIREFQASRTCRHTNMMPIQRARKAQKEPLQDAPDAQVHAHNRLFIGQQDAE